WELMNEPEWVTAAKPLTKYRPEENKTVPQEAMLDFLHEGVGRINDKRLPASLSSASPSSKSPSAFRSTIGFAHYDTLFDWDSSALGVTLHQFHFYAQNGGKLPKHIFSFDYPCFIGEF